MTTAQNELWNEIQRFEIDDPHAEFSFSDRLARENGWTKLFTLEVIDEYKKFMFLQCVSDQPLTPSDQVDQAWHLHLLYTRSYWNDFCSDILKRQIHHGPTKGGKQERTKYKDLYNQTLQLYKNIFNTEPPSRVWPDATKRFSDIHFRRINLSTNWIIPKPSTLFS